MLWRRICRPRAGAGDRSRRRTEPGAERCGDLVPTPPSFVHEFAGSLLEFAFMEQAIELDQVLVFRSDLRADRPGLSLDWTLLFIPSRASRHALEASLRGARVASLVMKRDD